MELDKLLEHMVAKNASDLHIRAGCVPVCSDNDPCSSRTTVRAPRSPDCGPARALKARRSHPWQRVYVYDNYSFLAAKNATSEAIFGARKVLTS